MIVIGADTHKRSHTVAGVDGAIGRILAERTVKAKRRSFDDLLLWARALGTERVWAIEDCRHVSGALERFLLRRGEQVVRVAPKLMAETRRSSRDPAASPTRSPPSRSPGPQPARASTPCPSRAWRAASATCVCSSTTASGSSRSAPR